MSGTGQISQVCVHYLAHSPCPMTPVGPAYPSKTDTYCCLRCRRPSRLPLEALTRLILASHFRITALALHCLRLNRTSRLRLQGYVPTACQALSGLDFHQPVLYAPNWRTSLRCPILRSLATESLPSPSANFQGVKFDCP